MRTMKPRIILHGAKSVVFEEAFSLFQNGFEIVAITDNDPFLKGKNYNGVLITTPTVARSLNFDFVAICCVTSQSYESVFKQFVEGLMIEPERIISNAWTLDSRLTSLLYVSTLLADEGVQGSVAICGEFMGDYVLNTNLFFYDRELYLYFPLINEDMLLGRMPFPEKYITRKGGLTDSPISHDEKFAFVSLGTELYEPTYEYLEYFYPNMSKGGVIFVHNYFSSTKVGERKAIDDFMMKNSVTHLATEEDLLVLIKS